MQKQAEYTHARERDLGDILKKNAKVLCHFTLDGVDECARIDEVLDNLAKAFPKTKFVRIRPELGSKSPTLQMCNVSQPPAIVYFKNRRLSSWTNGFDQFGGRNWVFRRERDEIHRWNWRFTWPSRRAQKE